MFDFNYPNLLREIKAVGRLMGRTEEVVWTSQRGGLQLYQARHSGASVDMNSRFRTATDTKEKTMGIFEESRKIRTRGSSNGDVASIHGTNLV